MTKTKLLPTQEIDITKLLAKEDLPNYSAPGTGKTLTTIGAIEAMKLQSGRVICPVIAAPFWAETLSLELGAKVQMLKKGTDKIDKTADFHVMTYSMACAHFSRLMENDAEALVLDESHYLASPIAQRTIAVFGHKTDGEGALFSRSKYCFTLTGTPIMRYQDDLWSQLRAIQPELLTKYRSLDLGKFREHFTRQALKQYHSRMKPQMVVVGSKNEDVVRRMLYEDLKAIRRTMADVDGAMPPLTFRHIDVVAVPDKELNMLLRGKNVNDIAMLMESGDLAMAAARRLFGLAKAKAVAEYVTENAALHPVFVGYWHQEVGQQISSLIRRSGVSVERIGGDTPIMERDEIRQRFNSGATRVVLGQISAAGVSLNLQELCHHVVMAEMEWSPGKLNQFYKRVWRLGQKNHVQVDYCLADHALDEAVMRILRNKQTSIDRVSGDVEDMGLY